MLNMTTSYVLRFHPSVNRLYCPSEEVAKRALLDGLEESQIRVFGLPIRPSFCRAVISKVHFCLYQFSCVVELTFFEIKSVELTYWPKKVDFFFFFPIIG